MFIKINIQCKFLILFLPLVSSVYLSKSELLFPGISPSSSNSVCSDHCTSNVLAYLLIAQYPKKRRLIDASRSRVETPQHHHHHPPDPQTPHLLYPAAQLLTYFKRQKKASLVSLFTKYVILIKQGEHVVCIYM